MIAFRSVLFAFTLLASATRAFVPSSSSVKIPTRSMEVQMIGGLFQGLFGQTDAEITETVFFDMEIDGQPAGRIEMGLYGSVVPKTVENFKKVSCPKLSE